MNRTLSHWFLVTGHRSGAERERMVDGVGWRVMRLQKFLADAGKLGLFSRKWFSLGVGAFNCLSTDECCQWL